MIKNLVVAGSSFSVGTSDKQDARRNPITWSHLLLKEYDPEIYVNLAIPGAASSSISSNLIYFLETKKYINNNETVVIIDFSELDRYDVMCQVGHPNANPFFSWNNDLGFDWLTEGSFPVKKPPFNGAIQLNAGFEAVVLTSQLAILNCITYLESRNFTYRFMLTHNWIFDDSPQWFQDFLKKHSKNWITFDDCIGMHEYGLKNKVLHTDNYHLSMKGNADIYTYIKTTSILEGIKAYK